ncbi:MAG: hypothetical protein BGO90_00430 [Legionella sp. 40-6]|nr:sulfite exporter TauE/SafE family protein [Legionella sp.]OJY46283.1 MAG: hypothetical protein BGO90_00430 [Legionella sp. 40-6]
MILICLVSLIIILGLFSLFMIGVKLQQQPTANLTWKDYLTLFLSGVLAFFADTLGLGSFAVNRALTRVMETFDKNEIAAVNNIAQVLPGVLEALFFVYLFPVDLTTLLVLVAGAGIGGALSGVMIRYGSHYSSLLIKASYLFIISLLVLHQFRLLNLGGDLGALSTMQLFLGFFAMIVCGALTAVGVGLFIMVQGILFLMNLSPMFAFPIMTVAGAVQQPITSLIILQSTPNIPLKKTMIYSLSGCFGVLAAMYLFTQITVTWLHTLVFLILIYNLFVDDSVNRKKPCISKKACIGSLRLIH